MVEQLSDKELLGFIRAKLKSDYPDYSIKVLDKGQNLTPEIRQQLKNNEISVISIIDFIKGWDDDAFVKVPVNIYGRLAKERILNRGNYRLIELEALVPLSGAVEFTDFDYTFNWERTYYTPKGMTDCTNLDIDPKLVRYMCKKFGKPYIKAFKENREEAVEDIQADIYYQYREILTSLPREQTKEIEDFDYKY